MSLAIILKATLILFAVVNPIGSIPIFLQLTNKMTHKTRRNTFRTAVLTSFVILVSFLIVGEKVLTNFFNITIFDLMTAGGLLILIIVTVSLPLFQKELSIVNEEKLHGFFALLPEPGLSFFTWARWFNSEFQETISNQIEDEL